MALPTFGGVFSVQRLWRGQILVELCLSMLGRGNQADFSGRSDRGR